MSTNGIQASFVPIVDVKRGIIYLKSNFFSHNLSNVRILSKSFHLFENMYCPGSWWLTLHDRRASKDRAIRSLMEHCGLTGCPLTVFSV